MNDSAVPSAPALHVRVLLAEDDFEMRSWIEHLLALEGFEIESCRFGIELLDRLSESIGSGGNRAYDIVIADLDIHDRAAATLCRCLGRLEGIPPILAICAFGEAPWPAGQRPAGGRVVLVKPVDPLELLVSVRSLVVRRAS